MVSCFRCVRLFGNPWTRVTTSLLCPWDSPGKNTGVGCHALLQGIFLTQGSNPRLLHPLCWPAGSSLLVPPEKPSLCILTHVTGSFLSCFRVSPRVLSLAETEDCSFSRAPRWDRDCVGFCASSPLPITTTLHIFVVQLLSRVGVFLTPWTAVCQASLSLTISGSLLKLMSIQLVMPSNHLILCCPLLFLSSIFPSIRVFSNELALPIRWSKYWDFSFSISPSDDFQGWFLLGLTAHSHPFSSFFFNQSSFFFFSLKTKL